MIMTEERLLRAKSSHQLVQVSGQCQSLRREVFGLALALGFWLMPVRQSSQINSRPFLLLVIDNLSQHEFLAARLGALQCLKTNLFLLPRRTTCIFVGAASMFPSCLLHSASHPRRNSHRSEWLWFADCRYTCLSYLTFVLSARRPCCCQQCLNFLCRDSKIPVNLAWSVILAQCYLAKLLFCFHNNLYRTLFLRHALFLHSYFLIFSSFDFVWWWSIIVKENLFPAELKWADVMRFFFNLHYTLIDVAFITS